MLPDEDKRALSSFRFNMRWNSSIPLLSPPISAGISFPLPGPGGG